MLENIKVFLKKSWVYIMIGIGIAAATTVILKKKVDEYENVIQRMQTSHQEELDEIEEARKEERKKYEENERTYKERMATIQKEYDDAKKIFDEKKKSDVIDIVKKYNGKPDQLAERFSKVTGFKIILPED